MASKNIIPRTAGAARNRGARKARKVNHSKLSASEKKKWVLFKQAAPSTPRSHMICYYNPKTGAWDDCHWVS
ncbi:MAG: hypothetical protein QOF41_1244 [Methylobacteriaceae bacterium]|nr:hypothetical protein [Methylobacteriaceae bacterium]